MLDVRPFRAGRGALLVERLSSFGDGEQVCFLERLANPLEANRESACHTARNAHARETGEVQANGVDVGEIDRHRIGFVHAALERETRHRRACNHVASLECFGEVVRDEAANLLGLLFIRALHIPCHNIYEAPEGGLAGRLHPLWAALRGITGLDAALFGEAPWFFLLFLAAQLGCVLAALWALLRSLKKGPDALCRLWLLCLISLGGTLLAGLVLPLHMRAIYLFLWYPFVALSFALTLRLRPKAGALLSLLLCLFCLGNLVFIYVSSLRYAEAADRSQQKAFVRDAEAAGIRYLYGDWHTVPRYAVWADGVLCCGFWDEVTLQPMDYLNLQDIYTEEANAEALYLMSPWHEAPFLALAEERGAAVELFGQYHRALAYRSDRQLMRFP